MHELDLQLSHMLNGEFAEAWEISEKLEAIGPDNIKDPAGNVNFEMWLRHCFNRGWFLLQQGKYQEGSKLLEAGRHLNVYGSGLLKTSAPIFNPDEHTFKDKSIILSLEGGYGDEIIHARYATSIKNKGAKHVYIACAPELASVLRRIEGVDDVILRDQSHTVQHDYWIPGFSAGWICGYDFDTLPGTPYLTPIQSSVEIWKNIIKDSKIKVGIRWAGNPKFEHQQFRKFPPEFLINLAQHEELQIYSFQRDHNVQTLPESVVDLQHFLLSWEDTLAALANMDIVITSCTSIAHAAAALGKETWVLTPLLPYHTWTLGAPETTKSPYYDCVKLYRQQSKSKWNDTFQSLYSDLETKFNLKHVELPNCDKQYKKLNLGCGFNKVEGFTNVDSSPLCKPDKLIDLNSKTWDFPSDEFDHIFAKDILEHLDDTVAAIKEMYRVSQHGAIWEIQVPHWRCDTALDDPTHKRFITPGTFKLFDMKKCMERLSDKKAESYLAIEHNIDIEVCQVEYDFTKPWLKTFKESNATQQDIDHALNFMNNVAESTKILIQVFKPARYNQTEIDNVINKIT